jgi:hypothetical protein
MNIPHLSDMVVKRAVYAAALRIVRDGKALNLSRLRSYGARGSDERIMSLVERLRASGRLKDLDQSSPTWALPDAPMSHSEKEVKAYRKAWRNIRKVKNQDWMTEKSELVECEER